MTDIRCDSTCPHYLCRPLSEFPRCTLADRRFSRADPDGPLPPPAWCPRRVPKLPFPENRS